MHTLKIKGGIITPEITSSLFGTASYAQTSSYFSGVIPPSVSSSYAETASYLLGFVTSASFSSTASYWSGSIPPSVSASFAETASYLNGSVTSASYAETSSYSLSTKYAFVATLASDQATGANVTPVTLSGLIFSYEANSTYRIWIFGNVQPTAATTGCGFQFDLSTAVTSIALIFNHQLANTGTLTGGHSIADNASVGVSSGMPGTSQYPIIGDGLLRTGANAGTAQLMFRSETTAVTTCKGGFTLVVEKIQ